MKLLTKEIEKRIPRLYSQEDVQSDEKKVWAKFFLPSGRATWYAVEGEVRESQDGNDFLFYGYVVSPLGPDCDEWGYFTLNQLAEVRGAFGLRVERDRYFDPKPMGKVFATEMVA